MAVRGKEYARLYERIRTDALSRVIALPDVSKTMLPVFLPSDALYQHSLFVFAGEDDGLFGALTSSFHWLWATKWCPTLETRPRYHPGRCFTTLALPPMTTAIDSAGRALNEHRSTSMEERKVGITTLYNLVTSPEESSKDIVWLRELHQNLDSAVTTAYGWEDLDVTLGHHPTDRFGVRWTVAPEMQHEIVRRLLELNRARVVNQTRSAST